MTTTFFAVATNTDKAFQYPELKRLKWIPLKSKTIQFVNCLQVHFNNIADAQSLYDFLKSKNILTFKSWKP